MTLVGLTNQEVPTLAGREFTLYLKGTSCPIPAIHNDILGLLGLPDLDRVETIECRIRNSVSKDTPLLCWAGREGKVFGVDLRVRTTDKMQDREYAGVFLLKVFSNEEGVVCTHSDGECRLQRTQYLCEPANNLQLVAIALPHGGNQDLFAGAPILAFSHHLGLDERRKKGEAFVCYLMKNAGVSQRAFTTDGQTSVRRWSELTDELLRPRDRIALAHDLACAVEMLHRRHIQHCDLSPDNILVIRSANPALEPRLALIDFDSFYSPDVPVLPSHKRQLFGFSDGPTVRNGDRPPPLLRDIFKDHGWGLGAHARVEEVSGSSGSHYLIRDSHDGKRSANYLLERGKGTEWHIFLLGAPGHENYQAPIDLLADVRPWERYDNFSLGMLIHELLCRLHTGFDGALIEQKLVDKLSGAQPPDVREFCGPARFILHKTILDLLERVFSGDMDWPKPMEWATVLKEDAVYQVCPGPMRAGWRRPRQWLDALRNGVIGWLRGRRRPETRARRPQQPCLWPLPRMKRAGTPSWFRQVPPKWRLQWLEEIDPTQRQALFAQQGLRQDDTYCAVCGSPLRL